jgi:hypothetical protein
MFLVGIAKYRHFSVQIVEIIFSRCAASFKRTPLISSSDYPYIKNQP